MLTLMLCRPLAVVVVAKFKTTEELIQLANDSMFGLAASVFSRDITTAITTAHALQAGTVWVNQHHLPEKNVPFGGYKRESPICLFPASRECALIMFKSQQNRARAKTLERKHSQLTLNSRLCTSTSLPHHHSKFQIPEHQV